MALKHNVSLATALRYKGRGPMWAFILHRLGGLGMAILLTVHILSTALGGPVGQFLNDLYMHWAFQIVVYFFVLFHAVNGLRITLLDLWPSLWVYGREALWIEWAVFLPIYGLAVYTILSTALGG